MRLLALIAVLVILFFVGRWAARRMRIKERLQDNVQRTREQFRRLKCSMLKLFKFALVCAIGGLTISAGYYFSLSDAEREELNRKSVERRQAETIKKQAEEEQKRQMALEKQGDTHRTAQMQRESTASQPVIVGAATCYQRGVSYYKEIGSYPYLKSFPNVGRPADENILSMCANNPTAFDWQK
jgi:hypothetical protein